MERPEFVTELQSVNELAARLVESKKPADEVSASLALWLETLRDHEDLAFAMANHRDTPLPILMALAVYGDDRTRSRLAMRSDADPAILTLLASDSNEGTQGHVAHNPNTPDEVLRTFLDHPWAKLRDRARSRLDDIDGDKNPSG